MSEIDLKLAGPAIKKLTAQARAKVGRALYSSAMRGVEVIQTQIIPSRVPQPVDRGVYRAGWKSGPINAGGAVVGGELWNSEVEAAFIEGGVRPENVRIGRAMLAAISEWAMRKGFAPNQKEAMSMAWAVAKAMKRRGIFNRPGPGLGILHELMTRLMPKIIEDEVTAELRR